MEKRTASGRSSGRALNCILRFILGSLLWIVSIAIDAHIHKTSFVTKRFVFVEYRSPLGIVADCNLSCERWHFVFPVLRAEPILLLDFDCPRGGRPTVLAGIGHVRKGPYRLKQGMAATASSAIYQPGQVTVG
jgi:hypothetical protein